MSVIKDIAEMRSVTELTALHHSPEFDIGDPDHPLNAVRDELLDRPGVQGSYFAVNFANVVERAADTDISREDLVALEREWIEIRPILQANEYGEDAFDHALIAYEERAASRDIDTAHEIDPGLAKAVEHEIEDLDFDR